MKLLCLDSNSILNRAFYGMPDLTNAKGQHTGIEEDNTILFDKNKISNKKEKAV